MSTAIAACNFVFTLAAIYLVERLGRRPLWVVSHAGVTATLALTAFSFYIEKNAVAICGLAFLTAFYAVGMGCLPWTVAAEVRVALATWETRWGISPFQIPFMIERRVAGIGLILV